MFKRFFLFVLWLIFVVPSALGQPPHTFTQYTSENGLSQKTIQNIMQDHKGLMWFTTWDGLYKFDGYTFTILNSAITVFGTSRRIVMDISGYKVMTIKYIVSIQVRNNFSPFLTKTIQHKTYMCYPQVVSGLQQLIMTCYI